MVPNRWTRFQSPCGNITLEKSLVLASKVICSFASLPWFSGVAKVAGLRGGQAGSKGLYQGACDLGG